MSGRGMNRRGHMSNKIPNVKLRPASSALPTKPREAETLNAMDQEMLKRLADQAEDEEISSAGLRQTRRPWERVLITFTGVEDKPRLVDLARKLGADVTNALTKETTHVVASGFGSAKYVYAVEHRIPVMRPEWIDETHSTWIAGRDVDLASSMEGNKLLPFTGLTISVSGVNDMERRKQLIEAINSNGGTYAKDLDCHATHLVSATPTEVRAPSAKVKWAVGNLKSAEAQRRAGKSVDQEDIKIVYEDWIWDCVGFEGRWKEDWYDARKVRRTCRSSYDEVMDGSAKQKMIQAYDRIETVYQEEPAILKKRKRDGMDTLVGEILSTAGGSVDRKPNISNLKSFMTRPDDMEVDTDTDGDNNQSREMDIDDKSTSSRRLHPDTSDRPIPTRKPSILHTSRTSAFAGPSKLSREIKMEPSSSSMPSSFPLTNTGLPEGYIPKPIFAGKRVTVALLNPVHGFDAAIEKHGAEIISEEDWRNGAKIDILIVRFHEQYQPDLSWIPEEDRPEVLTDCWIERCIQTQSALPIDENICYRPLKGKIPGAEKFKVHVAGFTKESQQTFTKRLVRAIGFDFSNKLARQTTHLVIAEASGMKYQRALEWSVIPMKESWLLAIVASGEMQPDGPYRHVVDKQESVVKVEEKEKSERSTSTAVGSEPVVKGIVKIEETVGGDQGQTVATPFVDRRLKMMPTHIDQFPSINDRPSTSSISFPLSPPRQETERLLNKAIIQPSPNRQSRLPSEPESAGKRMFDGESIDSKLSRNSSAPVPITSSPIAPPIPRSTSLASANLTGRPQISEMLKLLAQSPDPSTSPIDPSSGTRSKPQRRPRPSGGTGGISRLRTSMAYSATEREGAMDASSHHSTSPTKEYGMEEDMAQAGVGVDTGMFEESMRVDYIDPASERERKRVMDAMRRGELEGERSKSKKRRG